MASPQQKIKGNPAHKRMGNANLKARRARSWARGEERKEARRSAQARRHVANVKRGSSPWDDACEARRLRRQGRAA